MSEETPAPPPPAAKPEPRKAWVLVAALPAVLVVLALVFFRGNSTASFSGDDDVAAIVRQSRKINAFEPLESTVADAGDWLLTKGFHTYRAPDGLEKVDVTGGAVTKRDVAPVAVLLLGDPEFRAAVFPTTALGTEPDGVPWRVYELPAEGGAQPVAVAAALGPEVCFVIFAAMRADDLRGWLLARGVSCP